jgi:toxin ParE1/3/4
MKYHIVFTPDAEQDIEDSYLWYEGQAEGLGEDFRTELKATTGRIVLAPFGYQILEEDTRRALLNSFPHAVFFIVDGDRIVVTTCSHQHRDPQVWRSRR